MSEDMSFLDFLDTLPDADTKPIMDTVHQVSQPYALKKDDNQTGLSDILSPNRVFHQMKEKHEQFTEKERIGRAMINMKLANAGSNKARSEMLEHLSYMKRYGHTSQTCYTLEKYRELEKAYRAYGISPVGRKRTAGDYKKGLSTNKL